MTDIIQIGMTFKVVYLMLHIKIEKVLDAWELHADFDLDNRSKTSLRNKDLNYLS